MNKPGFVSINVKVSLILVTAITAVMCCYMIYSGAKMNREMESELKKISEIETIRLSENLVLPLWNFEPDVAENVLRTAMLEKHLYGAIVWDNDEIFTSLIRNDEWDVVKNDQKINGDYIYLQRVINKEDEIIGTIDLYITKRFFQENLKKSIVEMILTTVFVDIIIVLVLFVSLTKIFIKPVNIISSWAFNITGETGDLTTELDVMSHDEIGRLADSLNVMSKKLYQYQEHLEDLVLIRTRELDAAQKELVEKAHKAGMADIATGTLHNIGNILNSVQTSTSVMQDNVKNSNLTGFQKAVRMLADHMDCIEDFILHDPKGIKLLVYIQKLGGQFDKEFDDYGYHLNRLKDNINAITEIIRAQQTYAGAGGFNEKINLKKLVLDAITMLSVKSEKLGIEITMESTDIPDVYVQKTKLIHVMINLLKNAQESIIDSKNEEKTIRIVIDLDQMKQNVLIQVSDSGTGLTRDEAKIIFSHGYTTKDDGHGFGLHSSANYMTEMRGKLWADSPGKGHGSTFILQLPVS